MFDFVTNLWSGAQRVSTRMPPDLVSAGTLGLPQPLPPTPTDVCARDAGKSASRKQSKRQPSGHGALVLALMHEGRACTVTELAGLMECSVGESSKRIKAAGKLLKTRREGRFKLVSLRPMSLPEWERMAEAARRDLTA